MCGRFALFASEQDILGHFSLRGGFCMRSRYNIAPSQTILIVTMEEETVQFARWGLVAPWTSHDTDQLPPGHINARIETAAQKITFKNALAQRRCLIPASGYFEWTLFRGKKQPYFVSLKNQAFFAMAGITSVYQDQKKQLHLTVAILTQAAPSWLHRLHVRSPVIVSPQYYPEYLSKKNQQIEASWLLPLNEQNTKVFPVSTKMNHPTFDVKEAVTAL